MSLAISRTKEKNGLHIAINHQYAGKIQINTNFFTRLFSMLLFQSHEVEIGGKKYSVKKSLYIKHFKSLGADDNQANELRKVDNYETALQMLNQAKLTTILNNNGKLWTHLEGKKQTALLKKYIKASDATTLIKYIGKGVPLAKFYTTEKNDIFYHRGHIQKHFSQFYLRTPLTIAAKIQGSAPVIRLLSTTYGMTNDELKYEETWQGETKCKKPIVHENAAQAAHVNAENPFCVCAPSKLIMRTRIVN